MTLTPSSLVWRIWTLQIFYNRCSLLVFTGYRGNSDPASCYVVPVVLVVPFSSRRRTCPPASLSGWKERHILDHWRRPDGARIGISASAVDERSLRSLIWTIKAVIYCRCYKKKPAFNETPVCQLSVWQVNMQYIFSSVSDNQKCCKKNLAQQISGCLSLIDWLIDWCNAALQILISSDAESWAEIKIVLTFMLLVQTI